MINRRFKNKQELENLITDLREKLAELEHEQWESWTKYIIENTPVKKRDLLYNDLKAKWEKNWKSYKDLPESVKNKDREWANKSLIVISKFFKDFANYLKKYTLRN